MSNIHDATRTTLVAVLACLCCLVADVHAAGIYKWTDAQGRVHYGDKPTGDAAVETVPVKPGVNDSAQQAAERLQRQQRVLEAMESRRNEHRQELVDKQAKIDDEKQHKKACNKLRNDLADYERGGTIWYDLDDQGERQFLDQNELEHRKDNLRNEIGRYCGSRY